MLRVGTERLVVGAAAIVADVGRVAIHGVGRAVFGEVPVQVAGARLGFVVDGPIEDRLRLDGEPAFGQTRRTAVEPVDGTRNGRADGPLVFAMLIPGFVGRDGFATLVMLEEVAHDVRIRERLRTQTEGVALREVRLVLDQHAIAPTFDVAAPMLVVVAMVVPVA